MPEWDCDAAGVECSCEDTEPMPSNEQPVSDYCPPPAVSLLEQLAAMGETAGGLMAWMFKHERYGIHSSCVTGILVYFESISAIDAAAIAEYTGTDAGFWLNQERLYRESLERRGEVMGERRRCAETVYVRDTYRRTGRGKTGFEMHYSRRTCSRYAEDGRDFCWQHPYKSWRQRLNETTRPAQQRNTVPGTNDTETAGSAPVTGAESAGKG